MTSTLNEASSNESWGIRDFYLYVYTCPAGCKICNPQNLKSCGAWALFDSEMTDPNNFNTSPWTVNGQNGNTLTSACAGTPLFGGFNVFGSGAKISRTFSGLPTHN